VSRSGYGDDDDWDEYSQWRYIRWRGRVTSAFRGKRGQDFLRELLAALDALPSKRLIADEIVTADGECCAIGALALQRKMDVSAVDVEDCEDVGRAFGIAGPMAAEIEHMNDERYDSSNYTPERRFAAMRRWIAKQIVVREDELEELTT
jgi:hypothetical protein